MARAINELPDTALDVVTTNGLTAHDLVVHVAAQESLLAQNLGVPTIADLDEDEIVARTHALLPRFADRDLDAAVDLWRASVEANRNWAIANPDRTRDLARSRPHARRHAARALVRNVDPHRRPAAGVGAPGDTAGTAAPLADVRPRGTNPAARRSRSRDARTTGRPRGSCSPARAAATGWSRWVPTMRHDVPDVTVTADVVDWCLLVGDRIAPAVMRYEVDGDLALGRDLVASAPALATL